MHASSLMEHTEFPDLLEFIHNFHPKNLNLFVHNSSSLNILVIYFFPSTTQPYIVSVYLLRTKKFNSKFCLFFCCAKIALKPTEYVGMLSLLLSYKAKKS